MILSTFFGFILGVFIGSFGLSSFSYILASVCFGFLFWIYKFFTKKEHKSVLLFLFLFFIGISLGLTRIYFSDQYRNSNLIQFADTKQMFIGTIVSEPDVREKSTMLSVRVDAVMIGMTTVPLKKTEKIIISTALYPEFLYGDKISFPATLSIPKEIKSESGRTFDYGGYLRVRGIWYTGGFVYPKLISRGGGNPVSRGLLSVKKSFTGAINNALPPPQSSLMAGLLLGTKQSLGKELLAEFSRAGVSHVVVLSGYNIAIVATSIMAFLSFLPATLSFLFGCIGIILFTILSGAGASAVRAAIMVLVALFTKRFNREYKAPRALGFAVVLMLAPNPLLLVFDPSFQLSILATIGIVFVSPIITPYLLWVTEKFGMREIFSSTIATQMTVLPFLVYTMGTLSLVALPVNILILATIPTTMLLGFLTGLFGLVSLWLSFIPALPSYILLWYQLTVVHLGSSLPFGAITIPTFSAWFVILIYIFIFSGLYFLQKKTT